MQSARHSQNNITAIANNVILCRQQTDSTSSSVNVFYLLFLHVVDVQWTARR